MHRSSPPLAIALLLAAFGSSAHGIAAHGIAAIGVAVVGALAAAPGAHAQAPVIYKWVDENGVAHYTTDRNRIPAAIRDRVIQGGDAARGGDWLRRDAGPAAAAPLPGAPAAALPTAPVAPAPRQAEGVELPEDSDGVHAVKADPDWSEAPGGERQWAPGELGEEEPPSTSRAAPVPVEAAPTRAVPTAPPVEAAPTAARPAPPPPPPPPPLEADGAPVTAGALPAAPPEPEPSAAPEPERQPIAAPAPPPPPEPTAPAAVAAPAPRHLPPDEQAELAALDAQIAEVEARIASDEEALMVLISEGDGAPRSALVDDPRFRDIAQRLPKLQADLERLRERRAQIQPVVSRP